MHGGKQVLQRHFRDPGSGDENLNHISATVSLENREHGGWGTSALPLSGMFPPWKSPHPDRAPGDYNLVTFIVETPAGVPPDPRLLHVTPGLTVLPVPLDQGAYNDVRVEKMGRKEQDRVTSLTGNHQPARRGTAFRAPPVAGDGSRRQRQIHEHTCYSPSPSGPGLQGSPGSPVSTVPLLQYAHPVGKHIPGFPRGLPCCF